MVRQCGLASCGASFVVHHKYRLAATTPARFTLAMPMAPVAFRAIGGATGKRGHKPSCMKKGEKND